MTDRPVEMSQCDNTAPVVDRTAATTDEVVVGSNHNGVFSRWNRRAMHNEIFRGASFLTREFFGFRTHLLE